MLPEVEGREVQSLFVLLNRGKLALVRLMALEDSLDLRQLTVESLQHSLPSPGVGSEHEHSASHTQDIWVG